jgi:hypothetical protein
VHWIYINTKAERHELTSQESHFTKHNPSLCSSSIRSQKMLEGGFAIAIFIMRATAKRHRLSFQFTYLPVVCEILNSHWKMQSSAVGFRLSDWQMQSGSWPAIWKTRRKKWASSSHWSNGNLTVFWEVMIARHPKSIKRRDQWPAHAGRSKP